MRNQMTYEIRGQSTSSAGWVLTRGLGVLRGALRPEGPGPQARPAGPVARTAPSTASAQISDLWLLLPAPYLRLSSDPLISDRRSQPLFHGTDRRITSPYPPSVPLTAAWTISPIGLVSWVIMKEDRGTPKPPVTERMKLAVGSTGIAPTLA